MDKGKGRSTHPGGGVRRATFSMDFMGGARSFRTVISQGSKSGNKALMPFPRFPPRAVRHGSRTCPPLCAKKNADDYSSVHQLNPVKTVVLSHPQTTRILSLPNTGRNAVFVTISRRRSRCQGGGGPVRSEPGWWRFAARRISKCSHALRTMNPITRYRCPNQPYLVSGQRTP